MKRNLPETSLEAYASLNAGQLQEMYGKIVFALRNIKSGTSQQIAATLKTTDDKVRKRLSEMEKMKMIYKPGHKLPTTSGRMAYVWALVGGEETVTQYMKKEKLLPGKSVQAYAKELNALAQTSLF